MTFNRSFWAIAAIGAASVGTTALPGCGSDAANNRDFGEPPNASLFDPGQGGSGGYGYGSSSPSSTPFVCPDPLKRCAHTITVPFNGETSVELRGDFGGPETWVPGKGIPMMKKGAVWSADLTVPFGKAVQYKFFAKDPAGFIDPSKPVITNPDSTTNNIFEGKTCEPAICEEEGALPAGVFDWRDSVIYFVFVDRFFDGNPANNFPVAGVSGGDSSIANYQGGDWAGVTKKINDNYFNDLRVNTLWITVPADNADVAGAGVGGDTHTYSGFHGYWPKIDASNPSVLQAESRFGTFDELKELVTAAHLKGLKVLFDYAMVHVHNTSKIYADHNDWFWPNSKDGTPDCVCGASCDWNRDAERCWFTNYLPHWNYTNSAARDYSTTQAVEWVKQTGVDGFRADAIKHIDVSWLTELRAKLKAEITANQTPAQRFYMVGETYEFGNRDILKKYIEPATKLDGQFDFPLRSILANAVLLRIQKMSELAAFMDTNDYFYGADAIMSTFIGNHDLPRAIHLAANERLWGDNQGDSGKDRGWNNQPGLVSEKAAYERLANAFAVLYTNRGAPLVYYGDEVGLAGGGDPDNRRFMPWSGLTANQIDLKNRIAKLGDIRTKHVALRRGVRTTLDKSDDVWAYSRVTAGDALYVAINRSDDKKNVSNLPAGALTDLVTGESATGPTVEIPARQTKIFVSGSP